MGSAHRQICRCHLKSVAMHSIPPERKPVALSNSSIYCGGKLLFPHSLQSQRRRKAASARRVLRAARSNLGGTDRIKADFRNLGEHL